MTTIFKSIKEILIVILILVVAGMYIFRPKPIEPDYSNYIEINGVEYKKLLESSDTVYMDVITEKITYVPTPGQTIYVDKLVEIPADVDTLGILNDYLAERTYNDTIPIDSIGNAYISDVVSRNRIMSRTAMFDYILPVITNTTIVETPPVNQVYFGGGLGLDRHNIINNVKTGIMVKTKRDKLFGVHVGLSNSESYTVSPEFQTGFESNTNTIFFVEGTMYWKIKWRRK